MKKFYAHLLIFMVLSNSVSYGFPRIKKISPSSLQVTHQLLKKFTKNSVAINQGFKVLRHDNAILQKEIQELSNKVDTVDKQSYFGAVFTGFTWLLVLLT